MEHLRVDLNAPEVAAVTRAAEVIRAGGVVAYPTEHLYALGCDPNNAVALTRLFAIKGRGPEMPLLLALGDVADLHDWCHGLPAGAGRLMEDWPAGLTVVLNAAPQVLPGVRAADGSVALRLIDTPVAGALLAAVGGALTATSANRTGQPASGDPKRVASLLQIDLLLDAGILPPGGRSTLVDVRQLPWQLLREGVVMRDRLPELGS